MNPQAGPSTGDDQVSYARALGLELERRVRRRKPRSKAPSSDLEGWVDRATWDRATTLMLEAAVLLHDAAQPPRAPGTIHVSATSWAFEMSEPEETA